MISSAAWIARGIAARHPEKHQLDDAELERISKLTNTELGEAERQLAQAQAAADDGWEDVDEDEDEDDDDNEDEAMDEDDAGGDPNAVSYTHLTLPTKA